MNIKLTIIRFSFILSIFSAYTFSEPISVEEAIREVCANSDSVKRMHESVKKSEEMVREKWSNALPVISANATAAKSHGSLFNSGTSSTSSGSRSNMTASAEDAPFSSLSQQASPVGSDSYVTQTQLIQMLEEFSKSRTSTIYSTGLSISQPIYTFGKIGTAIKVARQFDQAAKYGFQRNFQTLQLQAFDAFSQALLAEKAKTVSERSLARKRERFDFLDRNFRLGSGSKAQVLALKADVAGQNTSVLIARRDARTAHMYLNALMGRPIADSSGFDTTTSLSALVNAPIPLTEKAIETALTNRVDIKALDLMGKSTAGGAKIFRSMYLPSIAGIGSLGYSKFESDSKMMPTDWMTNWTLGIGIQWTLFDGFAYSAKAAQFSSDARKLEIAKTELSKYIEIEMRTAIAECAAADSNFAASQEMFAAAKESYDLTNSNFKQGSGQFADLQLADEQLLQAELGQSNARYRLLRSRAALQVSMGNDIIEIKK
jgi:outer membrane protein